jgi:oxygen-independent coproporphyrinogen-3 oxidase
MTPEEAVATITPDLLARYDRPGPRYTSYPTAPQFDSSFDANTYGRRLKVAAERPTDPLSLYVHIPFCEARCTYCGCNVVISPHKGPEEAYIDRLEREIDLVLEHLGERRTLNQVHWGGGTPTYLSPAQCRRLFDAIAARFSLTPDAEIALEIDPCVTSFEHLAVLRSAGFNRLSMGVQDVNPEVQEAVQRVQPLELTRGHVEEARRLGFASVNVDLIYGLPDQTESSFRTSVETVIRDLAPDRVACFSYAHVPWIKPHQEALDQSRMAQGWDKFRLFAAAVEAFGAADYRFIGFDHFARPGDELAAALDDGGLHRNFMGYTVMPASDQIGIGTTAIGDVGSAYAANRKNLARWGRAVDEGVLPIERGLLRTAEDDLRGAVIHEIICTLNLDANALETRFGIRFSDHFAEALEALAPMVGDGLVEIHGGGLTVTPVGRFFLRNLCMPFDAYLTKPTDKAPMYSRTV